MNHMRSIAIIVIITPQTGIQIIRQPSLIKPQRTKGPSNLGVSLPFRVEGAFDLLGDTLFGKRGLTVVVEADDSVAGDGEFVQHLVVEWVVLVGESGVDLEGVADEGGDEVGVPLAGLELGIVHFVAGVGVDPVHGHGLQRYDR